MKDAKFTIKPGTWSLLIVISILIWIGFAAWALANEPAPVAQPPREKTLTLPQKCRYLLRTPDPDSWDPVTETYPSNYEWEDCMGVGRK